MDDLVAESAFEIDPEVKNYRDEGNKPLYGQPSASRKLW